MEKFRLLVFFVIMNITGCGIKESRYESFSAKAEIQLDCPAALTAFQTDISPGIPSCGGCHFGTGSGTTALILTSGDDDANRKALSSAKDGTAIGIWNYLSGGHPGGTGNLSSAIITKWLDAENKCITDAQ